MKYPDPGPPLNGRRNPRYVRIGGPPYLRLDIVSRPSMTAGEHIQFALMKRWIRTISNGGCELDFGHICEIGDDGLIPDIMKMEQRAELLWTRFLADDVCDRMIDEEGNA